MNVFAHDLNNSTLVLRVILTVCLNSTTLVLSHWWTSMPLLSAERYMCVLDNRGELTTCNNWDRKLGEPNVDGAAERFKAFFADKFWNPYTTRIRTHLVSVFFVIECTRMRCYRTIVRLPACFSWWHLRVNNEKFEQSGYGYWHHHRTFVEV